MTKRTKHLFKVKEYMEIRENRNKIKIAVLFLLLLVVEIVCMYLINSRNIRIISMSDKDNYESADFI